MPLQAREQALQMFNLGLLSLKCRGLAERLYWATCAKIRDHCRKSGKVPEELEDLETILSDTYFCNFSVFQSLPDSWAIDQLFPIMPIHRLDEKPTRNAVLADITCDSDGKIDHFVSQREVKRTLELHELRPAKNITWPHFWSAHIRKLSAICTICSAIRTSCTSDYMSKAAGGSRKSSKATRPQSAGLHAIRRRTTVPAILPRLRTRGARRPHESGRKPGSAALL